MNEWMMKVLGLMSPAPNARTTDIDLPYEGPWEEVDPQVRMALLRAAEKHQLPEDQLFRQARAESGFDPAATNGKMMGLMQLSPLIRKHYGVEDPLDPMQNADVGAQYLKELLGMFKGDMTKALAAYNAGPTAVRKHKGVPPIKETQQYVKKILMGR